MKEVTKKSKIDKLLNGVERIGNKVPHPAIIFLGLIVLVVMLSQIFSMMGQNVTYDALNLETGEFEPTTIFVRSLLSAEGLRFILTTPVSNLMSFQALGVTIVAMVGVGFAEEVGLIGAMIRKLVKVVPQRSLTAVLVFLGVLSSIASDAGYLVLIPLGAAAFYKVGRHPLAGLSAAFAGVSAGFGVNIIITPIDGMLTEILNDAVHIINPAYTVNLMANFYFNVISTILIVIVCTIINEKIIEPRLGEYKSQGIIESDENENEEKGLRAASVAFLFVLVGILFLTIPTWGPLRDPETLDLIGNTPFMDSIIALILLLFLVPGIVFGRAIGTVKSSVDIVTPIVKVISNLGGLIFLLLIISQFIAYFNFTNLGTVWAVSSADAIESMNMSSLALLLSFLGLTVILDFVLVGAVPKFAILTPIFVPLLYQLGVAPEVILAAYRVGDSPINVITPLMPYFALIVTFAAKYEKKTGIGTVVSLMLPHALILLVLWIVLFIVFYVVHIPLGPGIFMNLN
ncbi:AbgT family transporter [Enterococcus sp. OL5]|uniref:AbgT family transporter n=1 Tax=Enterococcus sp. OL5 TaxID=2590214 RepID=UPI00112C8FC0|nr:AbgT family transporter [Enterococcus sp. OL5]TPR55072.1 AbgT family transporter [Enterococcus sp. OL5]